MIKTGFNRIMEIIGKIIEAPQTGHKTRLGEAQFFTLNTRPEPSIIED